MENHPFFMTKLPENEDNLPPAVEGILRALKQISTF